MTVSGCLYSKKQNHQFDNLAGIFQHVTHLANGKLRRMKCRKDEYDEAPRHMLLPG